MVLIAPVGSRKGTVIAFAGLALTAAALVGCLGPEPSPRPTVRPTPSASQASGVPALPSSIDPCTLLAAEQVSAVNGVTYKDGNAQPPANGLSMCSWDNATARAFVEVGFAFWPSAADAEAAYDAAITSASEASYAITPVASIADSAAIARRTPPTGTARGAVFVRRGALVVTVDFDGGTAPTDAGLRAAVTLVLGGLPALAR